MAKLSGKVAVVTGASKGIGAAIAEELAKDGASVIVNYASSAQGADAIVAKIKAGGGKAKAVRADVSKPAEAKQLIAAAVSEFGRIDILVNNAAVYDFLPLDQITEAHFDRMFDLNVKGFCSPRKPRRLRLATRRIHYQYRFHGVADSASGRFRV